MPPSIEVDPSSLATSLSTHGYVLIPSFLSPSELTTLRRAASDLTAAARSGHWPHVRTVGKQFPPWPSPSPSAPLPIWGVQHLLHPSLPIPESDRAEFIKLYFSPSLLDISTALLSCEESPPAGRDDLVMELFNMLVRPDPPAPPSVGGEKEKGFALTWHRDDIPWTADPQEEAAALARPAWHAQWNLALCDDEALVVVPGSHRRVRTAEERAAGDRRGEMPGAEVVKLRAGDVAFYDSNIIHRGVYDGTRERMTLHGSVGHVRGSEARARNVLQHGVGSYVEDCDFSCLGEEEREVAEGMRRRLVDMGRGRGHAGFSLDG